MKTYFLEVEDDRIFDVAIQKGPLLHNNAYLGRFNKCISTVSYT